MAEIERRALDDARWLITLDTAGDAAEALFEDRYDATRIMYKDLRGG
jgi:hypothetical protein